MSPYTHFTKSSPPIAIYHGDQDFVIRVFLSRLMAEYADTIGNRDLELREILWAGHGFIQHLQAEEILTNSIITLLNYLGINPPTTSGGWGSNNNSNGLYEAQDAKVQNGFVKSSAGANG